MRKKCIFLEDYELQLKLNEREKMMQDLVEVMKKIKYKMNKLHIKRKEYHYHHHHHTQCIPLQENYGQDLGREERWQLIPTEESAVKESLGSRKAFKLRETCNLQTQ